jgi:hypothetical protein
MNELMAEGLGDLFTKYGEPPVVVPSGVWLELKVA